MKKKYEGKYASQPAATGGKRDKYTGKSAEEIRREMRKTVVMLCGLYLIAGLACFAFLSRAWFAKIDKVSAQSSTSSMEGNPALFITRGDARISGKTYETKITGDVFPNKLYPISTPDVENWWYVSGWDGTKANEYTKASVSDNGTYLVGDKRYTAYNVATYTVYASEGNSFDVYLNPDGALQVVTGGSAPKQLLDAVRVGVVVNDVLKFVYIPVAETGTGNSSGASENTYYMINNSGELQTADYSYLTDLSAYTAVAPVDDDSPFTAVGKTALFVADETGTKVDLYIWLEGTDAQCMIGQSDNANDLAMSIFFAGIAKN